ncbi:DUF6728 family protein [Persicobacter sp. CCB-QB2]|uniref:DUF6728 family protein n=1 Tax=Persicobacter sp. CCB-QB2 TaxID=1561025 RepID=UPI0006A9E22B|nr:DUF6728 family protein [Persicobacter sp. CCB-QB2]
MTDDQPKRKGWKAYFEFSEVLGYFFRKPDPDRPKSFSLKMMHGVNKISIIMFLLGVIYLIVRQLSY